MAYLYLNFEENLQSGSKNWDDFCTESLQAQYEKLKAEDTMEKWEPEWKDEVDLSMRESAESAVV